MIYKFCNSWNCANINVIEDCHLKPLKMCVLFRHGAAQGLLSEMEDSFSEMILNIISRNVISWLKMTGETPEVRSD